MSGLAGESLCITRGIKKALPPLGGAGVVAVVKFSLCGVGVCASSCKLIEGAAKDVTKFNGVWKCKSCLSGFP